MVIPKLSISVPPVSQYPLSIFRYRSSLIILTFFRVTELASHSTDRGMMHSKHIRHIPRASDIFCHGGSSYALFMLNGAVNCLIVKRTGCRAAAPIQNTIDG